LRKTTFYLDSDYPHRQLKFSTVYGERRSRGCSLLIIVWAMTMIAGVIIAAWTAETLGWGEWAGVLAGVGVFGWLGIRALFDVLAYAPARRRYQALLQGQLLTGEVVHSRLKGNQLEVTYRFRAPNGRMLKGTQRKKFRRPPSPPEPGTRVQILFTDGHHYIML